MSSRLYVGNLAAEANEAELRELFEESGDIRVVTVSMYGRREATVGCAFVEVATEKDARFAAAVLHRSLLHGREIDILPAEPRLTLRRVSPPPSRSWTAR